MSFWSSLGLSVEQVLAIVVKAAIEGLVAQAQSNPAGVVNAVKNIAAEVSKSN